MSPETTVMEPDAIFYFPEWKRGDDVNSFCYQHGWFPKDEIDFHLWAGITRSNGIGRHYLAIKF